MHLKAHKRFLIAAIPLCVVITYQFITVNNTTYINQQN